MLVVVSRSAQAVGRFEKTRGLSPGFFETTGNPWTAERTTERLGCSALVIARSTIDSAAPTGRKVKAQGRAKRRPGIGVPETTQALKGRNRRRVNPCVMFRPFRAWANWGGGARRSPVYPGWRCALPWAISLCPVGANDPVEVTGEVRRLIGAIFSKMTIPDKPKSSKQRYRLTPLGKTIRARSIARGTVASSFSFVGFVQRSPDHLIQTSHKQPSHNLKSKNRQPMDRGTYHRARGLFGFGYRAIIHRSGRPNGAQGDSPGQSEAPPWVHCALVSIAVGD